MKEGNGVDKRIVQGIVLVHRQGEKGRYDQQSILDWVMYNVKLWS